MRKSAGLTIPELLVAAFLMVVFGSALWGVYGMTFHLHDVVIGHNSSAALNRTAVDTVADHLRNAQLVESDISGYYKNCAIHAGAQTDITYYAEDPNDPDAFEKVRYRLNGTNLERIDAGGTNVVATNIQSFSLTYYSAKSYNGSWKTTTDPHAPTTAELEALAGVLIETTVAKDGYSTKYTSMVRLRNSPKKSRLSGI